MESKISSTKGVFVLLPKGFNTSSHSKRKHKNEKWFLEESWYKAYEKNWTHISQKLKDLNKCSYDTLLDIVNYVKSLYDDNAQDLDNIIPCAALLTGMNQPDYGSQFNMLIDKLRDEVSPHIAMVNSDDVTSIHQIIQSVVWQLMFGYDVAELSEDDECLDTTIVKTLKRPKKNQCTMISLRKWYQNNYVKNISPDKSERTKYKKKPLVIILPDFESFNYKVLQDFILILSSYMSTLPLILIFGIATSVSEIHKSFPYHVSSKLLVTVFQTQSSIQYFNQVIDEVIIDNKYPFLLSGRAFQTLSDIFMLYDFSVTGFLQKYRYCINNHFFNDNKKVLCCEKSSVNAVTKCLTTEELEDIRHLASFRPYVEKQSSDTKIALLTDDDYFRKDLSKNIKDFHEYLHCFYTSMRMLCDFVKELPYSSLGKTIREILPKCTIGPLTETNSYKEFIKLLNMQSKNVLVESIASALRVVEEALRNIPVKTKENESNGSESILKSIKVNLLTFSRHIHQASMEHTVVVPEGDMEQDDSKNIVLSRQQLKQKLLEATRKERVQSEFEMVRSRFISYLDEMFTMNLQPPQIQPFHELFVFNDIMSIKKHLIGSYRGAIHTALSNPHAYLKCSCCSGLGDRVSPSMPDICIAYKLHLECGKLINLYDWLQAFAAVLDPDSTDDEARLVSPQIQARFNRVVEELQFLGFIKSYKRKTDHVVRLTW